MIEFIGGVLGDLVRSGRIVDIALGLIVVELGALAWLRSRSRSAVFDVGFVAHLAAGAFLLLALRAALTGASWLAVAGWLFGGLVAHLVDLGARLRSGG
ncbi:MAG: hypothetical protein ABL908_03880 [Hyphomicrobium sp.]